MDVSIPLKPHQDSLPIIYDHAHPSHQDKRTVAEGGESAQRDPGDGIFRRPGGTRRAARGRIDGATRGGFPEAVESRPAAGLCGRRGDRGGDEPDAAGARHPERGWECHSYGARPGDRTGRIASAGSDRHGLRSGHAGTAGPGAHGNGRGRKIPDHVFLVAVPAGGTGRGGPGDRSGWAKQ